MGWIEGLARAEGLNDRERDEVEALIDVYRRARRRNEVIERYYEADVRPRPIGPDTLMSQVRLDVDIACHWPKKAVHSLASIVRFDDFVFEGGERDLALDTVLRDCGFHSAYARHRVGILKNGCCFATVGRGANGHAYVRLHSANTAAAIMDATTERMRSGLVVAETSVTEWSRKKAVPVKVNLHMPGEVVVIERGTTNADVNRWRSERMALDGDTCLMVPLVYRPTETKPLGSSRIDATIRDLVDDVLHIRQVLVLSTELYAIPMRYVVGLSAQNLADLKENPKWALYLNPFFTATRDSKGHTPEMGQLPANSPAALLELLYFDAKQFASSTGVPLNSLGVVQDNPSSAEAIAEGRKDMTDEAQDFIDNQMKPALRQVALLAMMVEHNVTSPDALDESQRSVLARFKNPAMPSISASTDAAMKIATVNPSFAQTSVFFEMVGFDRETIRRIEGEQRMNMARQAAAIRPVLTQNRDVEEGEAMELRQAQTPPLTIGEGNEA